MKTITMIMLGLLTLAARSDLHSYLQTLTNLNGVGATALIDPWDIHTGEVGYLGYPYYYHNERTALLATGHVYKVIDHSIVVRVSSSHPPEKHTGFHGHLYVIIDDVDTSDFASGSTVPDWCYRVVGTRDFKTDDDHTVTAHILKVVNVEKELESYRKKLDATMKRIQKKHEQAIKKVIQARKDKKISHDAKEQALEKLDRDAVVDIQQVIDSIMKGKK